MLRSASAPGKIILSGEYAVLFGKRGIAVPSSMSMNVQFTPGKPSIEWIREEIRPSSTAYVGSIAKQIQKRSGQTGTFRIGGTLPIGKGMGASTAMVIAMCRAAVGEDCEEIARTIEDTVNPGHSGLDFAVIWSNAPLLFRQHEHPTAATIDLSFLRSVQLIDSGAPVEATPELVAWVRSRYEAGEPDTRSAIETIGSCTERILEGESIKTVMRDHHRAQIMLGVVPKETQQVIAEIESSGGSAKVLGAGGRTGGGGMVLVLPA